MKLQTFSSEHARDAAGTQLGSPPVLSSWQAMTATVAHVFAAWRDRRRKQAALADLASMDPAILADIGFGRAEPKDAAASLLDYHPACVASLSMHMPATERKSDRHDPEEPTQA